jgi:4-amino-4-deoxy-L-arabinose transferase-like glycosyltransferase
MSSRPNPLDGIREITDEHQPSDPAHHPHIGHSRTSLYLCTIGLLWALIYVPGLFSPGLMDDADAVHAEASREMLSRHDFITLHANGVRYLDKAPLLYWLTAGSYAAFGFSEFSTRLPLSLFVLAALLAVFLLARDIAGNDAGFFSALILATAVGPYIFTRFLIPDVVVGLWLTITVHLFWRSLNVSRPSLALCWSLGIVTALNVLTKGLIGAVFPVGIIGLYLLITGNLRHLLKLRLFSTAAVFFAVAAPWHLLAILRNPPQGEAKGFFWFYFINEQVNRFLNKRIPRDYDKVPLWLFWGLILVWLLPWSPYLVAALRQLPLRLRKLRAQLTSEQQALLLLVIWALVILVFFSFSTRQEYYVIPALPALAVIAGLWLARESTAPGDSTMRRLAGRCAGLIMGLGIAVFVLAAFFILKVPPLPANAELAEVLKKTPELYALSFGHFFDLTPKAMGAFRFPLALTGAAFLVGTTLSWLFRRRSCGLKANLALTLMMVVVLYAVHLALITFSPILGSKVLAAAIRADYHPGDVVVVDGEYSAASSVNFYTGIQLHLVNGRVNDLWYGSLFPDAPPIFENDASFAQLWLGSHRVFFITFNERGPEKLRRLGSAYHELAHSGGKAVFVNQP